MSDYWVGDRAGRRLGPIGLEVLRDLIRSGRLVGLDKVSTDGTNFRPLLEFPEIARLFDEVHGAAREAADQVEAGRLMREIGALKAKPVHEVFGLKPDDSIQAYRASFFALVKRFYPDRIPKEGHATLRHAYGEMFHMLSELMQQVEARNAPRPAAAAPAKPTPTYQPREFIGWERRSDNRVYCEVVCTVQNAATIFNGHKLVNLSNGGFFLAAPTSPPLGEQVEVKLKFLEPVHVIDTVASVVWENQVGDARTPRGFGCRFLRLAEEEKTFIHEFVRKALASGAGGA